MIQMQLGLGQGVGQGVYVFTDGNQQPMPQQFSNVAGYLAPGAVGADRAAADRGTGQTQEDRQRLRNISEQNARARDQVRGGPLQDSSQWHRKVLVSELTASRPELVWA